MSDYLGLTHKCPNPVCTETVDNALLACYACWNTLPSSLRGRINADHRSGKKRDAALVREAKRIWERSL